MYSNINSYNQENLSQSTPFLPDPFFGHVDLVNKNNYQINFRIERDGTNIMRVRLSVGDKYSREEIIAKHFLTHLSRMGVINSDPLFLKRDQPWDFQIQLDDVMINLEITAISDNENQFMWSNEQDKLKNLLSKEIPNDKDFNKVKRYYSPEFLDKIKLEKINGIYSPRLILTSQYSQNASLKKHVLAAVKKKLEKKHPDKERTILIIDSRMSSISAKDVLDLQKELELEVQKYPFLEIWFYVGCYSDNDGRNAAFMLCQLK